MRIRSRVTTIRFVMKVMVTLNLGLIFTPGVIYGEDIKELFGFELGSIYNSADRKITEGTVSTFDVFLFPVHSETPLNIFSRFHIKTDRKTSEIFQIIGEKSELSQMECTAASHRLLAYLNDKHSDQNPIKTLVFEGFESLDSKRRALVSCIAWDNANVLSLQLNYYDRQIYERLIPVKPYVMEGFD